MHLSSHMSNFLFDFQTFKSHTFTTSIKKKKENLNMNKKHKEKERMKDEWN